MLEEFELQLDEGVTLIPGDGGIFDVKHDGELVYSKHRTGRFPEPGEVPKSIS